MNAYLTSHRLPPEYDGLELSSIPNWQPIDSVAIANAAAFQNSFDLDIAQTQSLFSYQAAGEANGFDGFALFTQDINRVQPFAPATTIPDASQLNAGAATSTIAEPAAVEPEQRRALTIRPGTLALAKSYIDRLRAVPFFQNAIDPEHRTSGSNEWVIHGQHTLDGHPLFANDPHLALRMPPIFHVVDLATRGMDVIGGSFPGTPFVVIGHNEFIAWGATSSLQDVTDTFQEQIVAAPNLPSGLRTIYRGIPEAVKALPQKFLFNLVSDGLTDNLAAAPPGGQVGNTSIPAAILIVPRRNNGPIVDLDRSRVLR